MISFNASEWSSNCIVSHSLCFDLTYLITLFASYFGCCARIQTKIVALAQYNVPACAGSPDIVFFAHATLSLIVATTSIYIKNRFLHLYLSFCCFASSSFNSSSPCSNCIASHSLYFDPVHLNTLFASYFE